MALSPNWWVGAHLVATVAQRQAAAAVNDAIAQATWLLYQAMLDRVPLV
jgi:hypothetical protein